MPGSTTPKLRAGKSPPNKKGNYDRVPSDNDNDNVNDLDNDNDNVLENNHNIDHGDEDDEFESDPLVLEDGDNTNKSNRRQYYRREDESDAVLCSWVGTIVLLGVMVLASFVYWNMTRNHGNGNNTTSDSIVPGHIRTRAPQPSAANSIGNDDDDDKITSNNDDDVVIPNKGKETTREPGTFYFDPFAAIHTSNPLDLSLEAVPEYYAQTLVPPVWDPAAAIDGNDNNNDNNNDNDNDNNNDSNRLGYMMQPDFVNGTVAFVSEGDLYIAVWNNDINSATRSSLPAMKLTTTVGNVRNPKINPVYPYWIAYTATYTARRDVYLLDLRRKTHGSQPAMRLTYWPISAGVRGLVGWKDDGKTLIFQAYSDQVSLEDVRLYELTLALDPTDTPYNFDATTTTNSSLKTINKTMTPPRPTTIPHPQVLQTTPVPLAQALEGAFHDHEDCWYFTRFQQSSETIRYQGGTAEAIWSWCKDDELAVALTTHQFNGTSKAPSIFTFRTTSPKDNQEHKFHYLLFLSDRGPNTDPNDSNKWKPTTMNLWAMPLPEKEDLMDLANPANSSTTTTTPPKIPSFDPSHFVQLTTVSCAFGGMSLREYSVDPVTKNVVLRIGADLYWMSAQTIQQKLEAAMPSTRRYLEDEHNIDAVYTPDSIGGSSGAQVRQVDKSSSNVNKNDTQEDRRNAAEDGTEIKKLGIIVYSDFHEHQERIISVEVPDDLNTGDIFETAFGTTAFLMAIRGQVFVSPVVEDFDSMTTAFSGAGRNLPPRRYRVAPGSQLGGAVRILACRHVPVLMEDKTFSRRLAVILATDPTSPTAEHAFYLIEVQSDASPSFVSLNDLPEPFLGGSKNGGSVRDGGLGTVMAYSVRVSPCGRRMAWVDTDGRICVMTMPLYKEQASEYSDYIVLPKENEQGEPVIGAEAELMWSPGGRYLAVEHSARNQFTIISIVDCGDPLMVGEEGVRENMDNKASGIKIGRIVQATPSRFNSYSPYWGKSTFDQNYESKSDTLAEAYKSDAEPEVATTTLYFLTDRDIVNKQPSPWGTRSPNVWFERDTIVYALPLLPQERKLDTLSGHFSGGGALELYVENILDLHALTMKEDRGLSSPPSQAPSVSQPEEHFPQDPDIQFGPPDLTFARRAYRMANIPKSTYVSLVSQAHDDGSMLLVEKVSKKYFLKIASLDDFPSDKVEMKEVKKEIDDYGLSTSRDYLFVTVDGKVVVVPNSASGLGNLLDLDSPTENIAYTQGLTVSVWPALEYQQMYSDAWRMMRDYFYDPDMTGIDWFQMFQRYLPLVRRCAKREELDDVLAQMASETSALHTFVYGGEYNEPLQNDETKTSHIPASFGIAVQRSAEWKGYVITSLPELDPDFGLVDDEGIYSPLSDRTLRMSGQRGLRVGDVIVSINGESVMQVPDIHMLLRGMAHRSVRLDVLRLSEQPDTENVKPEPVIAVPIPNPDDLLYSAWEWKTRQSAKNLAEKAGFTVGYVHLRSMSSLEDGDAFYRGYFPDYDKDAFIVDVRHNRGGNIDWWVLDVLQRKAWMYWQSRSSNATTGGLGWDEQFAFRGHIVVLIDEKTSSDGEGFSRGMSELGLGRLIGTRTWGGGIWLSSDNNLVDGGIATAPEDGTYNEKFGQGLGIEQMGVEPDILVDNNPRTNYDGKDTQLEHAIKVLKEWLEEEPVVVPTAPSKKRNMAYDETETCAPNP